MKPLFCFKPKSIRKPILILMAILFLSAPARAFETDKIDIHGFISQGYMESTANNSYKDVDQGTFQFNELGINFATRPTSKLLIGTQMFAFDTGAIGNDKLTVDWALADYNIHESVGLRVGKMKAPMGLYNEVRDVDAVRTGVFLPPGVYLDFLRDSMLAITGAGMYGKIDLPWLGSLDLQAMGGGMNLEPDGGTAQGVIALGAVKKVDEVDVQSAYAGSLRWNTPLPGLLLGVSRNNVDLTTMGDMAPGAQLVLDYDDFETHVYSAEFTWDNLVIAGEVSRMYIDYRGTVSALNYVETGLIKMLGWYSGASYRLTDRFETGLTYSEFYNDADDKSGHNKPPGKEFDAWQKEWILSLRFDLMESWILKLEGHMVDGTNLCLAQYNPVFNDYKRYWRLWAIKVTYVF